MTADLSALIARLEAAEVGSRELDGEIALAFSYPRDVWGDAFDRPFAVDGPAFHNDAATWSGGGKSWSAPTFTTSLDAAIALAERLGLDVAAILTAAVFFASQSGAKINAALIAKFACIAILRAKQGERE